MTKHPPKAERRLYRVCVNLGNATACEVLSHATLARALQRLHEKRSFVARNGVRNARLWLERDDPDGTRRSSDGKTWTLLPLQEPAR